jgi:basic amino acid/polyamine antiporter, APA family
MAVSLAHPRPRRRRQKPRVLVGYQRLLVPVAENIESEEAIDVASRLAAEHGSSITVVAVVEIPPVLPLDAHMREEEAHAHTLLHRAAAVAEGYGVTVSLETLRGRDAASAIVNEALARNAQLLVVGAPRRLSSKRGVGIFGHTVEHVLKHAHCRVMIVGQSLPQQPTA